MKIVRTDSELQLPHVDATLRDEGHDLVLLPDGVSEAELADAVRDADLVLMCYTPITRRILDSAPRLKGIVKYGVGIDAIDIPAAIERGVPVVNIPEYAEETVAEGAFALMIALAKKLQPLGRVMQRDGWAWPEQRWLGSDIAGKTVGIVGLGKIGRSVARMAGAGFRANVIAYNPDMSEARIQAAGASKRDDLQQLLSESDFVSLHCTLNETTRGLIGEAELNAMKPTAYLINTSRGALVDEAALLRALEAGWIAGAGLDVFANEPLKRSGHPLSRLFELDQVIMSPHLTFYTKEAMQRLEYETLERCAEVVSGKPVYVKSHDPRLRAQTRGVIFG
ncbi:phosphoglycerate dehydrogenase-like oxidoreductase [Hoeflea sp. IMCC20628]|uniref:2-hydroxyacid dehydrogenase n=1 Tax=Hoeflea sp. IMCC20628 TaxID=1620421 RepID=UPI00063AD436|nr:C-terminal binding protein [Hoeflea sp. IMCC20628]AKI00879.1 phosphoglycerate dehydrogenase-like oxidoreductase [Hoeflea sp. IMCC20628]